jgi:branched-chain amino acid transport system ATP-binding protein
VRTFQHTTVFSGLTVEDNLLSAHYIRDTRSPWGALFHSAAYRSARKKALDRVERVLTLMRMEARRLTLAADLSYGELRYLEIALALMTEPSILLLDEPAAGLNMHESEALRSVIMGLRESGLTIVLIEHNMNLVMSCCDRVVVLNFGKVIADDSADVVQRDPRVMEVYLGGAATFIAQR